MTPKGPNQYELRLARTFGNHVPFVCDKIGGDTGIFRKLVPYLGCSKVRSASIDHWHRVSDSQSNLVHFILLNLLQYCTP